MFAYRKHDNGPGEPDRRLPSHHRLTHGQVQIEAPHTLSVLILLGQQLRAGHLLLLALHHAPTAPKH